MKQRPRNRNGNLILQTTISLPEIQQRVQWAPTDIRTEPNEEHFALVDQHRQLAGSFFYSEEADQLIILIHDEEQTKTLPTFVHEDEVDWVALHDVQLPNSLPFNDGQLTSHLHEAHINRQVWLYADELSTDQQPPQAEAFWQIHLQFGPIASGIPFLHECAEVLRTNPDLVDAQVTPATIQALRLHSTQEGDILLEFHDE